MRRSRCIIFFTPCKNNIIFSQLRSIYVRLLSNVVANSFWVYDDVHEDALPYYVLWVYHKYLLWRKIFQKFTKKM